ncbi:hypothetical protein SUDANB145_05224 [Streptomyces sp. enrichment culture]|uniref:hypothetical protein n=1 Tax=Streptomyces sp. enrichment culture TaxID=1795815 RepID=UPI003F55EEDE
MDRPQLHRQQSFLDLAAIEAGHGEVIRRETAPAPPARADGSDEDLPSVFLSTPGGTDLAVTSDEEGKLTVWAWRRAGDTWGWVREHRPEFTTGVKAFAGAVIAVGFAIQARSGKEEDEAAKWTQVAGNMLMSMTQLSDFSHYFHSAVKNFRANPKNSVYDLSKSIAQLGAMGTGISNALVPAFQEGAKTVSGLAAAISTAAGFYATGKTGLELAAERRKDNLGRTLPRVDIETPAPSHVMSYLPPSVPPQGTERGTGPDDGTDARPAGMWRSFRKPVPDPFGVDLEANRETAGRPGVRNPVAGDQLREVTEHDAAADGGRAIPSRQPPAAGPDTSSRKGRSR